MSVQTGKKAVWKKYKVPVPQDTDRQTCYSLLGEYMLTRVSKAVVGKRIQPCGYLSSTRDASCFS